MARHRGFAPFARRMDKYARDLRLNLADEIKSVALNVTNVVADETPVDTSQAISNWIVSPAQPAEGTRPPFVPGEGGNTKPRSMAAVNQVAKAALRGYNNPDVPIYIVNNLRYIGRLNDGYSAQAPANFVQTAVSVGALQVRGIRVLRIRR